MTLEERLKEARSHANLSQKGLADLLEITDRTLKRYETDASNVSVSLVSKMAMICGVNEAWLALGKGTMLSDRTTPEDKNSRSDKYAHPQCHHTSRKKLIKNGPNGIEIPQWPGQPSDEFEFIPMAEAALNAGGGNFVFSERTNGKFYAFRRNFIRYVATSVKNLILMKVEGDSMAPKIEHGDSVLIDTGRHQPVNFGYFAFGLDDLVVIKQLEMLGEGKVCLRSINKIYASMERDLDRVRIVGQVLWIDRVMLQTPVFF